MSLLDKIKNVASDATGNTGPLQTWSITALGAEHIKDEDKFSKSDPYLKIEFGGKHEKTHVIKNERSPQWNETFNFQVHEGHIKDINLKLMDADTLIDDSIGSATIPKLQLPLLPNEEKIFKLPMLKNHQVTGIVNLRVKHDSGQPFSSTLPPPTNNQTSNIQPTYYPQQNFNQTQMQPQPQIQNQNQNQPQFQQQPYMNNPQSNVGQRF